MFDSKACLAGVALSILLAVPSALAADHAVQIKGMKFVPANLTLAAGDTVTFTNLDAMPHTATASIGSFDTGRLAKGKSKKLTIKGTGRIAYVCALHPAMKGSLTVK